MQMLLHFHQRGKQGAKILLNIHQKINLKGYYRWQEDQIDFKEQGSVNYLYRMDINEIAFLNKIKDSLNWHNLTTR